MAESEQPKKRPSHWVLWWQVDQSEVDQQIAGYGTLGIFKSARGISALCLCFSMAVTTAFVYFKALNPSAYADVGLFAILAFFIYLGHRWAMIAAMLLWTSEKILLVVSGLNGLHLNGVTLVEQFFWWTIYMHAFYLAFRVEQKRRELARIVAS